MIKNYFNITWSLLEFDVKFKKFRCESAMFIFKWKVTWNYVYIVPLNDWVKMNEKQKQCLLHNCCISCKLVEFLLKRGCRWFYILLFLPTSSNFHSEIKFHYYSFLLLLFTLIQTVKKCSINLQDWVDFKVLQCLDL